MKRLVSDEQSFSWLIQRTTFGLNTFTTSYIVLHSKNTTSRVRINKFGEQPPRTLPCSAVSATANHKPKKHPSFHIR